jgi:heme oxygenase (biliverdin-producing, ferredoxin)
MQSLRAATQEIHRRVESAPLSQTMAAGGVSRQDYVALLVQLVRIHCELESHLRRHPSLQVVYQPWMERLPALLRDLEVLDPEACAPPLPAVTSLIGKIADWSATNPAAMLGCLYIFEGSRLGSMHLARPLARALDLVGGEGVGLDYHVQDMNRRPHLWKQFQQSMNEFFSEKEHESIVAAAVTTFLALEELYWSLSPSSAPAAEIALLQAQV